MPPRSMFLTLCIAAFAATGCGGSNDGAATAPVGPDMRTPAAPGPGSPPGQLPDSATAQVGATQGHSVTGALALRALPGGGVNIGGALQGLPPNGEFGFHVHERGDCSAPDASSAGEHFNPTASEHGHPGSETHHAGDMVNVQSDDAGVAQVDFTLGDVTLHDGRETDILGKAVVVHANPDDFTTQPSGNSGDRIACGVIAAAG